MYLTGGDLWKSSPVFFMGGKKGRDPKNVNKKKRESGNSSTLGTMKEGPGNKIGNEVPKKSTRKLGTLLSFQCLDLETVIPF